MNKVKELRLIDLDNIASEKVNYSIIMREVFGFSTILPILKKLRFKKAFQKAYALVEMYRNIDITKLDYSENCTIKKPIHIDNITFKAMMDLQYTRNNNTQSNVSEFMASIIAKSCYSSNIDGDYDTQKNEYKEFEKKILQSPLIEMVGLFNYIENSIQESEKTWNQRFHSVAIEDPMYEAAGWDRMSQFNVIITISNICQDFNLSYEEAWQISYALSQTNSYMKATRSHAQEQMKRLSEIQMEEKRRISKSR